MNNRAFNYDLPRKKINPEPCCWLVAKGVSMGAMVISCATISNTYSFCVQTQMALASPNIIYNIRVVLTYKT